jgi:hypothetical protein
MKLTLTMNVAGPSWIRLTIGPAQAFTASSIA